MESRFTNFSTLLILIIFSITFQISSQTTNKTLTGIVLDKTSGKPIPSVNIYVSNSTTGTTSDFEGLFSLNKIRLNNIELIVSSIGYKAVRESIHFGVNDLTKNIKIELEPFSYELQEIDVEEDEDNEWQRMFRTFKRFFVGSGPNSKETEILNPYYINLKKTGSTLIATCPVPIEIENKSLGYKLIYLLTKFELTIPKLHFSGVASFIEMPDEDTENNRKIMENRFSTYTGSIHHFAKVTARGFYKEKELVAISGEEITPDSLFNLNRLHLANSGFEVYHADELPTNEFKIHTVSDLNINDYIVESKYADELILTFKEYLMVKFFPETIGSRALANRNEETSYFTLDRYSVSLNPKYGLLDEESVITIGKWAGRRISDMLPIDYEVPENLKGRKEIF